MRLVRTVVFLVLLPVWALPVFAQVDTIEVKRSNELRNFSFEATAITITDSGAIGVGGRSLYNEPAGHHSSVSYSPDRNPFGGGYSVKMENHSEQVQSPTGAIIEKNVRTDDNARNVSEVSFNSPKTLYFDNHDLDLGGAQQINLNQQYRAKYGVWFDSVYRYIDGRDPFIDPFPDPINGNFGITNGFLEQNFVIAQQGIVNFDFSTSYLYFDWWTISDRQLYIEAFDSLGASQGSFSGLIGSGTDSLYGNISKVVFHNDGGLVCLANLSYELQSSPNTIVGNWKFDEGSGDTAFDYSGNGNDGIIYGAAWTSGKLNGGLRFDGLDDKLIVPDSDILDIGTFDLTLMAWIKPETEQTQSYIQIIGKNAGYGTGGYNMVISRDENCKLRFLIDWLSDRVVATFPSSPNLCDDMWHHVAVVFDRDADATGYVDGSNIGAISIVASDGQSISNNRNIWMGDFELAPNRFNGSMDEVRIYSRALSGAEIESLYNSVRIEYPLVKAISFQNEGTPEYNDQDKIMSLDSVNAPTTYGTVVNNYYANGTAPDWFDGISLTFDVSSASVDSSWLGLLQAYIEKGDCSGFGCDANWHHFIALQGEKNATYEDNPPSSLFKSFNFNSGWIYDTVPASWISGDTLKITLRLWNARVDMVRLTGPGGAATPNTFITNGPGENQHLDTNEVTFAWTGIDDSTSVQNLLFSYSLDSTTFNPFSYDTSHAFTGLAEGWHTFMVRAMDESQNIDPTPATRRFAVDMTSPNIQITSGPSEGEWVASSTVTFAWTGSDNLTDVANLLFSYKIDDDTFSTFTLDTSRTYTSLSEGPHTFVVKAKDKAGNIDYTPPQRSFSVGLINLQPVSIVTPDSAFCNQTIQISWTITNNGVGPAKGTWVDKIYLSNDNQIGLDTLLATFSHTDSLDPGQSYTITDSVLLPDNIQGAYWIVVGSEGGNFLLDDQPVNISIPPHPDLQVTDIQVPQEGWSGQGIYVQWAVANSGDAVANKRWKEYVYLSSDDSIGSDVKLSEFNYTEGLGVGQNYTHIHPVTLPEDISGNFWIVVRTDVENNISEYEFENNNVKISVESLFIYQTPYPDLKLSIVEGPPSAVSGQSIDVSWTVTNNGGGATDAPIWYDLVYLSMDTLLGAGDFPLGSFQNFSYLGPGESYQQTEQVVLPWQLAGPYYLVVVADGTNRLSEHAGEDNNSKTSSTISVQFAQEPYAYLEASVIQVPSAAWSGEQITVTWQVTNTGKATAVSSYYAGWDDAMALSQDQFYDDMDIWLSSHFFHTDTLAPGESDTLTDQVRLPDTVSGTWYLIIIPDTHGLASVGGKPGASAVTITPKPPADLEITSISLSSDTVNSGDKVVVDWTVTNNGLAPTLQSSWKDALYLSENDTLDVGVDILLRELTYSGNLKVDSSYIQTDTVTIPSNLSGPYYLFVCTDVDSVVNEGSWEDNNCSHAPSPIEIIFTPPDLQVSNIVPFSNAWSGQSVPVQWTVINAGTGRTATESWHDKIYISQDTTLNTGQDTLLYDFTHTGALGPTKSYSESTEVTLPDGLSGTYYQIVVTDADSEVYEHLSEGNNTNYVASQINLTPPPDLQVTSILASAQAWSGRSMPVQWNVVNSGTGGTVTQVWHDKIYLSIDTFFNVTVDTLIRDFTHTGALGVGKKYIENREVTIPSGISGIFYLFIYTDADSNIYEHLAENNNFKYVQVQISEPPSELPDLQVTSFQTPSEVLAGGLLTVQWTVTNKGLYPTPPTPSYWFDALYLSDDDTLDLGSDILLERFSYNSGLPPDSSYSRSRNVTIPNNISGQYHLFILIDDKDTIPESSETNNSVYSVIQVKLKPPDLRVSVVNTPDTVVSGQPAMVNWSVQNIGIGPTQASEWYDGLYLSKDQILDETDHILGSLQHIGAVDSAQSYSDSSEVEIPLGLSGPYYVIARTDKNNNVYEHNNENNNYTRTQSAIQVILPPPVDLVVSSITVPDSAIAGDSVQINWTVTNQGANTAQGQWTDALYLSADTLWSLEDPHIGNALHTGGLEPGQTYLVAYKLDIADYIGTLEGDLPGVVPGDYHVIVRTDIRNNVSEVDETNNAGTSADTTSVHVVALALGVPHSAQLNTGDKDYCRVQVGEGEDLRIVLNTEDDSAYTELYVRYGEIPDRIHYEARHTEVNQADHAVIVSQTQQGIYYMMIWGDFVPGGQTTYSLLVDTLEFGITSLGNSEAGDIGETTVEIFGAQFGEGAKASLRRAGDQTNWANQDYLVNSTHLNARFETEGLELDSWDVVVTNPDSSEVALTDGLVVVPGHPPQLSVSIIGPSAVRPDQSVAYLINAYNPSNVNVPRAAIWVETRSDIQISVISDAITAEDQGLELDHEYDSFVNEEGKRVVVLLLYNVGPKQTKSTRMSIRPLGTGSYSFSTEAFVLTRSDMDEVLVDGTVEGIKQGWIELSPDELDGEDCGSPGEPGWAECTVRSIYEYRQAHVDALRDVRGLVESAIRMIYSLGLYPEPGVGGFRSLFSWFYEWWNVLKKHATKEPVAGKFESVRPRDPNEKIGPTRRDEDNLITVVQSLPYTIYFENIPDATAPAQAIHIADQFDPDLDWRKFRLGEITFGDTSVTVPDDRAYWHTTVDLDSLNLRLEIDAGINAYTGEAHWYFETIDANTGRPPLDPLAGFLPPNDSTGRGEGHVSYMIKAKDDLSDGTEISNKATIIFDTNDPIETNEVLNVTYTVLPDLVATSFGIQYDQIPLIRGDSVVFSATVENQGEKEAGSFKVHLFGGDPDSGAAQIGQAQQLSGIGAKGSREVLFTCTPQEVTSKRKIYLVIDPENAVAEVNEKNNTRSINVSEIAYRPGDVNADGRITLSDVIYLVNYIFRHGAPPQPLASGDTRCEGRNPTLSDVIYLVNYLFKGWAAPCEQNPFLLVPHLAGNADSVQVILSDIRIQEDGIIQVPVEVICNTYLAACQLGLEYDPEIVQIIEPELTTRSQKMGLYWGQFGDTLKLGILDVYGKQYIGPGTGMLLALNVRMKDNRPLNLNSINVTKAVFVDTLARELQVKVFNQLGKYSLIPQSFSLNQNYPNPFNATTVIEYALPKDTRVNITIYNILGRKVKTLVDEFQLVGSKKVIWDGRNNQGDKVASGVYFLRMRTEEFTKSKKMILIK